MRIKIGDCKLFFDVEGAKLVPDGLKMRERPTLVLLHGGPGMDHSMFKPELSPLAEVAQLIYLDFRSNGRSDRTSPERWTLENCANDVQAFCEALEIEKPVVLGTSFGAWVAIDYATRFPTHPSKLILCSASARERIDRRLKVFERLGGAEARDAAEALFSTQSQEATVTWFRKCIPLYTRRPLGPEFGARIISNFDLGRNFDSSKINFTESLSRIACPTLVLAGEDDPMATIADAEDLAAAIPAHLVRLERFSNAGHGVVHDQPERFLQVVREFIAS